ncbi:hypothetical protein KR222_005885, partial [Zaprionus bogoriensis]
QDSGASSACTGQKKFNSSSGSSSSGSSSSSSSRSGSSSGSSSSGSGSGSGSSSDSGSEDSGSSSSASSKSARVEPVATDADKAAEQPNFPNPEDDEVDEVSTALDEYFRNKLKNKLIVAFKAELPAVQSGLKNPNLLRIPNFMSVETQPYEAHTYANSIDPEELNDQEIRDAFLTKLKTTVRWRESQDRVTGELYKESNARFVRWSDGSQTFHVGGEAFDVVQHPVSGSQNQLYIRLGNYYLPQCAIKEKLTLRPKLESNFGLSHVQGLRRRAFCRPLSSCVKVLMDLTTNPVLDRERKVKEERNQQRKEKCQMLREQKNQHKPCVKPMRHCTADDSDVEMQMQPIDAYQDLASASATSEVKRSSGGIRTNRNTNIKFAKYEEGSDPDDDG